MVAPAPTPDGNITALEPLTVEIVEALRYFRGSGHRSQIIQYIEAAHRRAGQPAGDALTADITATFERHLGEGNDPRPFRLPFGPGSLRWALAEAIGRA